MSAAVAYFSNPVNKKTKAPEQYAAIKMRTPGFFLSLAVEHGVSAEMLTIIIFLYLLKHTL